MFRSAPESSSGYVFDRCLKRQYTESWYVTGWEVGGLNPFRGRKAYCWRGAVTTLFSHR